MNSLQEPLDTSFDSTSLWAAEAAVDLSDKIAKQYTDNGTFSLSGSPLYCKLGYVEEWTDEENPSLYSVQMGEQPIIRMLPSILFAERVQTQIYQSLRKAALVDVPIDSAAWRVLLLAAADRSLPSINRSIHAAVRDLASCPTVSEMAGLNQITTQPIGYEEDMGRWSIDRWVEKVISPIQSSIGRNMKVWTSKDMADSLLVQGDQTVSVVPPGPVSIPVRSAVEKVLSTRRAEPG